MKNKLGICIFCVIVLGVCLTIGSISWSKREMKDDPTEQIVEQQARETKQEESISPSVETNKELTYYKYMIYQDGERLTVYESDSTTIYMQTDIMVAQLPEDVREQLDLGIGIRTEEELYDFLESYSSWLVEC